MTSYKLIYFDFRGRAEAIRMLFTLAKQPYEDHRVVYSEWPAQKSQTPFEKLPILEVIDEATGETVVLSQSMTIARFVANKFNMAGKSDLEKAICDMIVDQVSDALTLLIRIYTEHMSDQEKLMAALKQAALDLFPSHLRGIEKILANNRNKQGYLVGDSITLADLHLITFYDWLREEKLVVLDKLPLLKKHDEMICSIPEIAEHIARNASVRVSIRW